MTDQTRPRSRQKSNPIAADSMQGRAPGAPPLDTRNEQSARQPLPGVSNEGTRGGTGTQQTGWGARQQAVRMGSRAEAERKGESQQSGYGGVEQNQHSGSQESAAASPGKQQTDEAKPKNKRPPRS